MVTTASEARGGRVGTLMPPGESGHSRSLDLDSFGPTLLARVNARLDSGIAVIWSQSDVATIPEFGKKVQLELRKQSSQTAKLTGKVNEAQQEAGSVSLRMAEVGQKADTRHIAMTKQTEERGQSGGGRQSRRNPTEVVGSEAPKFQPISDLPWLLPAPLKRAWRQRFGRRVEVTRAANGMPRHCWRRT